MADTTKFPQIPSTVWNGVRAALRRSPRTKLDPATLSAELSVQPVAARQYLAELRRVGLLNEDGAATELGARWRLDDHLEDTVREILQSAYPDTLISLAPPGSADRSKVESWFLNQGMGQGTARNKAGTYLMIANSTGQQETGEEGAPAKPDRQVRRATVSKAPRDRYAASKGQLNSADAKSPSEPIPLNVNMQIHISADASLDQINAIFLAMRNYLHGDPVSN